MTEGTSFLTETYDESTLSSEETVLKRFCQEVDDEQSRRDRELFDFLEDLVNSEEFLKKTQNKVERSAQVTPSLDRREEDEKLTEIDYRLTEYFKNRHAAEELKRIKEECQKNRKIRKCQEEAIRIIKDHIFRSAQIHACHLQERISRKLEKPDFQRKMAEYVVASRKIKRHQKIGRAKREMSIINKLAMEQRRWEKIKAMQNKTYDYKVRRREKIIPDMEIIGIPVTLVERPTVREIEEKPSEEPLIEEIIKEPETPIKEPKKKGKEKKKGKDKSKKPEKKAKKSEKKPKKEKKAKKDKKKGKKKGEPVDLVIPDVPTTNPRLKIVPGDPECMVDIIRKHEELLMVIDERKSLDEMMDEKELTYERDRASYWRPNLVLFEDFENGRVYKKKVTIVNGGKVSKKIKLHAAIIEDGFDPSWINVDNFGIVLLIPGLSFHVTVTFQPRQLTRVTYGKLIFTSYEANENRYGQFAVPIKCTPFTAEIIVAPANVDFGTVPFWKVKTLKPKFLRIVSTDKQPYRVTIRKVVNESELEDISNSLDSENVEEILQQIVDYCHQTFRFSRYSAGLDPNSGFQLKIVPLNFDHLGNYWERYECQFYRDIGDGTRLAGCKECFVSAEITGHFIGVRPEILDYGVCAFGSVYQVAFEVHNADCSSHRVLVQFPSSLKSYLSSNLAEFFIPSRASRDVSLKFMPRKDMLDGFPSFYDPDTNILNFPVKVAVTTKHCADVPPVKLTIFAILNDNSGLSVRPLNLEYAKRNGDDFYLDLGDCMLKETVHAKIGITNSTAAEQHFGFLDLPQCVRISPNYGFGTLSPYESKQLKVLFSPDYLDVPRDKIDGLRFPLTFRISVTTLKSIGAIKKPFDHRKLRRSFDRMLALLRRKDDVLEKEMEEVVRVLRNSKEIVDRYVCESFDYVNRDGGMGMLEIEGYEGRGDAPPSDDDQHLRNINSNKIWLAANIIEMPVTFSHQFVVFPDTPCGSFSTVTIQLKTKKFLSDNRCLCGYGDAKPSTSQDFEIHFRMTGNDAQVTVEPICGDLASGKCLDLHLIARPEVPKEIVEDKARYLKMVEIREEKLKAVLLKREKEREARSLKEQQMMAKKKKSDKSAKKTKEKKGKKGKNVETKQEVPEEREEEPLPEITVDPQEVQINYFDLYPAEMVVWRDFTPRVLEADFVCEITYRGKNINQEPHVLYLKAICNVVSPHFTHNLDRQHLDFGAAAIGSSKRKMLELQNIREVSIRPRTSLLSPVGFFSCPGANDVAVPPEHVLKLPVTFKPNGEQEFTMSKFLTKAPFGVQTKRFSSIGYHPGLDPTGSLRAYRIKVSPGDYDPEHFECAYKKYNKAGSLWKRKAETEEYSKQLGFKNNKVLQERRYFKSLGGPGSYDVADTIYKQKSSSVLKDVNFGHEPKFLPSGNNNPGPGTYTKDLVLLSSTNKKQLTNKPPFEWDGFVDRFKLPAKPWSQPPNIYTPIDTESMEALLAKVVSKRGPYELFTGPRDPSTIKNHFAPPQRCAPDKYYSWPNGLDYLLNHSSKKRCGALLKDKRFRKKSTVRMLINDLTTCYRDPSEPSPATYDIKIDSITKLKPTLHPFNDSVTIVRKGVRWSLQPGPGRYNAQHPRCKKSKNQSWVFKSRTERIEHKSELYGLFPE